LTSASNAFAVDTPCVALASIPSAKKSSQRSQSLQVQQAGQQPNGQARSATDADATAEFHLVLTQHVQGCDGARRARLALKVGCQHLFDLRPRQPTCQHHQRVARIDHPVQSGAEEVRCAHGPNLLGINSPTNGS
jgi:hypothetical protein